MNEHPNDRERVTERERSTHVTERSSGTGIAAVVGGLVVAVLVIFWLWGGFDGGEEAALTETDVTIEENETALGAEEGADEMVGTGTEAEIELEGAPAPEGEETEIEVEETPVLEEGAEEGEAVQ